MFETLTSFLLLFFPAAADTLTSHTTQLNGQPFAYNAVVGTGEVSYIAYTKEGENRPITFAFNGGPGSASVWLHLGALGPRRAVTVEEGQSIFPPYQIIDNQETLLDLSDLVLIDPMGTGLSKAESEDNEKKHYSIRGDIVEVGKFIREYLTKNQRWNSPKYLLGESYGAIRAAGLADHLSSEFGIFFTGVLFISPAIDYQTFMFDPDNPLPYFLYLPSYATTAWYHGKLDPELTLEEVAQKGRDFIYKTYAPSLICPKCSDLDTISEEIAQLTALPLDLVKKHRGKVTEEIFAANLLAEERQAVGRFDARKTGFASSAMQDPSETEVVGIFSGAFHDYLHKELQVPCSYNLFTRQVHAQWNYQDWNPWGYPNLMGSLRNALTLKPDMRLFFGCGYFDLATPFCTAEYCIDHLDVPNISVQVEYYDAGHMFYLKPSARLKFKQDLIRFYMAKP